MSTKKDKDRDKDNEKDKEKHVDSLNYSKKSISASSKIVLDVGGVKYITTRSTLTKEPSMLTAMFSGNFPLIPEEDGSYFIDRDGEVFKYVLSYLRDGTVDSSAMRYREALLREANYFQLQGLVNILKDKTSQLRNVNSFFPRCHVLDLSCDGSADDGPEDLQQANPAAVAAANPNAHANQNPNIMGQAGRLGNQIRFTRMQWSGNYLVLGSSNGNITVYSMLANKVLYELKEHTDSVRTIVMKDNLLVSGGRDLKVKGWDLVSGTNLFTLSGDHRIMVTSVQFKDDYLISASLDGTVIIWDMWKQKQIHTLPHENTVFSVSVCGTNKLVIECGAAIYVYDLNTFKLLTEFKHCELVYVGDDQPVLIYYSQKPVATFSMWDLDKMELIKEWKKVNKPHVEVCAKSGDTLAVGSEDGEIQVYDLSTGSCINAFTAHISFVGLQIVENGILISGSKDGKICIWDIATGQRLRTFCHRGGLFSFKYDADLLVCGYDEEVRVWDFRPSPQAGDLLSRDSKTWY